MKDALHGPDGEKKELLAYLHPTTETEAKAALANVTYWPMRWPTLNVLIAWLVLAFLSLLFVTVGFYLICLGLAYVVKQLAFK